MKSVTITVHIENKEEKRYIQCEIEPPNCLMPGIQELILNELSKKISIALNEMYPKKEPKA